MATGVKGVIFFGTLTFFGGGEEAFYLVHLSYGLFTYGLTVASGGKITLDPMEGLHIPFR
jgi:hypothetical protein